MPVATAHQTIGPYWHLLDDPSWADLTRFGAEGEPVSINGRIADGAGMAVADACVEIWQSDPPTSEIFPGWGRAATDAEGKFRFVTIKPGPVRGRGNAVQAPHLALAIFARGLLRHLATRLYFSGEALNETDPLLSALDPARRGTLIARADGPGAWWLDINLQGPHETVFLDV